MIHNKTVKMSENFNKYIFLKPASKQPTLSIFAYVAAVFTKWKNKNIHVFKTTFFCKCSYVKCGFALSHAKSLPVYFFYVK